MVQRPVVGVGQNAFEPFLTSANKVMQTFLAAPFNWEWNRSELPTAFSTVVGQSDYTVSLNNFGYLEKAVLINSAATGATPPNFELEVFKILGRDGKQNRPQKIAILLDDNAGNITFRLFPVPDNIYTIDLTYQNSAITATSLAGTWAPIPDKFAFVYEQGMLAQMQMMYNQQLALSNMEIFFKQLVGISEGLSESDKDIFLTDALRFYKMRVAELTSTQQGRQTRA